MPYCVYLACSMLSFFSYFARLLSNLAGPNLPFLPPPPLFVSTSHSQLNVFPISLLLASCCHRESIIIKYQKYQIPKRQTPRNPTKPWKFRASSSHTVPIRLVDWKQCVLSTLCPNPHPFAWIYQCRTDLSGLFSRNALSHCILIRTFSFHFLRWVHCAGGKVHTDVELESFRTDVPAITS